jgi:hypothetical protein
LPSNKRKSAVIKVVYRVLLSRKKWGSQFYRGKGKKSNTKTQKLGLQWANNLWDKEKGNFCHICCIFHMWKLVD